MNNIEVEKINNSLTIRDASESDVSSITILTNELGYPSTELEILYRLKEMQARKEHRFLIAVDENQNVLGYIHLEERYLIERNPVLQIAALVVSEKCRGQGIGRQLMLKAEEYALMKGFNIFLTSGMREERQIAYRFYEQMGYKRKSTSTKFEKDLNN